MATYRLKTPIIQAFQYDGDLMSSKGNYYVPYWAIKAYQKGILYYNEDILCCIGPGNTIFEVKVGDYIQYVSEDCLMVRRKDIFEKNYEEFVKFNGNVG